MGATERKRSGRMRPWHVALVAILLAFAAAPPATAMAPLTIEVGGSELVLCGEGTRSKYLMDLYRVAMYLPRQSSDLSYIRRPDIAKAFRVDVLFDGPVPDEMPDDWRTELVPVLSSGQMQQMSQTFERLKPGDVILVTFNPGQGPEHGTRLALNGRTVITDPGPGVIDALIDLWLGPQPVSDEVKQALLGQQ